MIIIPSLCPNLPQIFRNLNYRHTNSAIRHTIHHQYYYQKTDCFPQLVRLSQMNDNVLITDINNE